MFRTVFIALATATIGLAAQAEEGGDLTLTINGEDYAYSLWASQSDWSGSESFGSVNIYAQPAGEDGIFKTFSLGFSLAAGKAERGEINFRTVSDGETTRLFAGADDDEGGLAVMVDSVSVSGEKLSVSGRFQSRMGPSDNFGRDIDLSDPMEIEGSFDVVLGPVE
ncbi:hypothetical protein [Maritimibacter sp. UBA3975]|uniref:hypothetical protein n=1 Tax=Maritimibacter sp. UBA3975 TaxID=1946833 RepID=UPI000C08EF39|nr:hypothetical protein [Maritimibacter sp. UBA3975]MAM61477.1 hypothetical protein [Maritimibacter sp.]|tara:strand:- start:2188 stop:2685 length:498 start_codon:yes stop_codon:yes gene_type:complete